MLEHTPILRRVTQLYQLYVAGIGIWMDSAQISGAESHSTAGATGTYDLTAPFSSVSCPKTMSTFFMQITGLESTFHF